MKSSRLSSRLAELVDAPDHALARETMKRWSDLSVLPELEHAFAGKLSLDEHSTLLTLLGFLVHNSGDEKAILLFKGLFDRPKTPMDHLLYAASNTGRLELAPLVRPYLLAKRGRYLIPVLQFIETARDLGALDDLVRLLDDPSETGVLAAMTLEKLGVPAIPHFFALLRRPPASKKKVEFQKRYVAIRAMKSLGDAETARELSRFRKEPAAKGYEVAILQALAGIRSPDSLEDVLLLVQGFLDADLLDAPRVHARLGMYQCAFDYFEAVGMHRDARLVKLVERLAFLPNFSRLWADERDQLRRLYDGAVAFPAEPSS